MNKTAVLSILFLTSLLLSTTTIQQVNSQSPQTIFVRSNGSIEPSSAPIQRSGEKLSLTSNINNPVVIEQNNVIFDGAGYTLEGSGSGVAFNLTCSNVTVQNVKIVNWQAGVLGVFDNNTVKDCSVSQCESAIKIYAQHYVILGNDFEHNVEAVRVGEGGLNLIAANNIVNNSYGLSLYDSWNIIVNNNFVNNSKAAIFLDVSGWSQTVYQNNFVNNLKDLIDESNGRGKPAQASLSPWDNGQIGNYWSVYPGSDINGDGFGDAPYQIPTYHSDNVSDSNKFVDRYPHIMPFNVNPASTELSVATAPTAPPQTNSTSNDEATATSFLQNVIQLDTSKYTITLGSGTLYAPNVGLPVDYLDYGLEHWSVGVRTANASFTISNNTVTAFTLEPTGGPLYSAYVISNSFETAQKIMQNYQTWTNDPDVTKMVTTLNSAGSLRNVTEQLDNINFEMVVSSRYTSFSWSYLYNGVDYSSVNLVINNLFEYPSMSFSDNRAINRIGNTDIAVSEQQAITAAENFVKGFSYNVDFGTGTITAVKDLNINETNIQANLTSTTRDQTTLYPYWRVEIPLDHTYPGETYAVTVNVWADSGLVFSAQRQITPPLTSTSTFSFDSSALVFVLEVSLISIVSFVVALVIVLVYVVRVDRKNTK